MLGATLRQAAPRLAYVIADHHNPTGLTLPDDERERLVALARATRTPLVVDETLAELALDDDAPAPAPLAPRDDDVIAIGSMSKAFWAGLRIGWIRASPTLVQRLALARATVDVSSPVIEQLVATELLADPDAVLVPQRAALRARRDALAAALESAAARLALRAPARRPLALDRARRPAQQRARRRRGPARRAPRRRPALRRRRRVRALPADPLHAAGAAARRRGRAARASPGARSPPTAPRPAAEPPALVA